MGLAAVGLLTAVSGAPGCPPVDFCDPTWVLAHPPALGREAGGDRESSPDCVGKGVAKGSYLPKLVPALPSNGTEAKEAEVLKPSLEFCLSRELKPWLRSLLPLDTKGAVH